MTDLNKINDFYSCNDGYSPFAVNRTMRKNKDYSSEPGFADSGPVYLQRNIRSCTMHLVGQGCSIGFFPSVNALFAPHASKLTFPKYFCNVYFRKQAS